MRGKDIIKYIEDRGLQDEYFFIGVSNYAYPISDFCATPQGVAITDDRTTRKELINEVNLFTICNECFNLISDAAAKDLYQSGKNMVVIRPDGSDADISNYSSFADALKDRLVFATGRMV